MTAVLDDAGVQKAAVVGHSMGGMVAYEFAGRATDIFKKYLPRLLSRL